MKALFGKNLDNTIVSKIGPSIVNISKGDASRLVKMVQAIPKEMRPEVVASGLASAFDKAGTRGTINFGSYAKWYEGLQQNKQAYAALMSNLPVGARTKLKDLYNVSSGISKASRERVTTGRVAAVKDSLMAENLTDKIMDVAAPAAGAVIGTATGGVAGSVVGASVGTLIRNALLGARTPALEAVDRLITSAEFMKAVNLAIKQQPKKAARILAFSKPFKDFQSTLKDPIPLSDRERWVLQAIEASSAQQSNSR